jgi:hypothetical protein
MWKCEDVKMCGCVNVRMCKFEDVEMWKCEDVQMCRCTDFSNVMIGHDLSNQKIKTWKTHQKVT